ncbi:MAG: GntR family transcriptional regulator [Lentisphaeria bacterium]|nr:GntR family transcriptional regulator [Lentisphaeria bacterium]
MSGSKHQKISAELRERIMLGRYTRRLPAVRVLAAEFDTSLSTMTKSIRTLSEAGLITPTSSGTLINELLPPRPKTGVINIVYEPLRDTAQDSDILLNALRLNIQADGFTPVFNEIIDKELYSNLDYWLKSQVDGHIFVYSTFYNFLLRQLTLQDIPFVVANWMPLNYGVHWVDFNNEQLWYLLVEQIIGHCGNHRIAFCFPARVPSGRRWLKERWQAIAEHFELPPYFNGKYCFTPQLQKTAEEWLALPEPPEIVICGHHDGQLLKTAFAKQGRKLQIVSGNKNANPDEDWTYEQQDYSLLGEKTWQVLKAVLAGKGGNPRKHSLEQKPKLQFGQTVIKTTQNTGN